MKIAYFDCHFGAAGDMLNASLLAAGLDEQLWLAELDKLAVPSGSFQVRISNVMRCNLSAKKMDVLDKSGVHIDQLFAARIGATASLEHGHDDHSVRGPRQHSADHAHDHHADSDHHHHGHAHDHDHPHEHSHGHANHDHLHVLGTQSSSPSLETRHLADILRLIERSPISTGAKDLASRIFMRLADAESKVHGVPPEEVHFHEVGAIDAVVDIVGFAIGYDLLGIERSYCSAVAVGSGRVRTQHGIFPVPGPATVYLLTESGATIAPSDIDFECLTPTGAAILCEIAAEWGRQPQFDRVSLAGYGAGTKDPADHPNVCRVLIGESKSNALSLVRDDEPPIASRAVREPVPGRFACEKIAVIEANLDDISPQLLGHTMEKLFSEGALDVTLTPVLMKKGRPGHTLTVLSTIENQTRLQELILTETTTIGVRAYHAERLVAQRKWEPVTLKSGRTIRIKLALDSRGQVINAQPEFEDCAETSRATGLALKDIILDAMHQYAILRGDGG